MKKVHFLFLVFILSTQYIICQPDWSAYGGIPNSATKTSVIDASENKWVAMFGGGISKFKPNETYDNYNMSNSGLPENFTTCIALDNLENKWIGTNSSGVVFFDGTTWSVYNTSNGLAGNQVNCITVDASNTKWIGLNLNGVSKFNGTTFTNYNTGNSSLPNDNVNCITIDASGNKWIGTYDGLAKFDGTNWTVYPVGSTAADHQIYSVVIESPTVIWIGTGGGLWKFDGNSTWVNYNTGNSGLPYNYINCIAIDQTNMKWIGTTQGGMAEFDGISSWTIYNTSNSNIPGLDVRDIDVDIDNNLWVCTNGGFAFYGEVPALGTDATLSDLFINGVSEPTFSPSVFYYYIELPYGTTANPVVTANTTDPQASLVVTDATSLPGFAYIDVTAEDGLTTAMYWIDFAVASTPSTDATLSDLKVDGTTISGFNPAIFTYNVVLPYSTTIVPTVTATVNYFNASMVITDAVGLPGTTTVVVTAEDGTTTETYTVNFNLASPNTDASLSDLLVDGVTVSGFSSSIFTYNIELPYGTTIIPNVTAVLNDLNAGMAITNATALPGSATVVVTAEDGTTTETYTVNFTLASPNTDASLSDLLVDGVTVSGFSPSTFTYNIELLYGTTIIPNVTAVLNDINAGMVITNATALPGSATVVVTAEDGTTTETYTVNFTLALPNTDASLSDLLVDGVTVSGFSSSIFTYNIELPYGTTIIPNVTAVLNDINAGMLITNAIALPGSATVVVTAEDGTTTETYTINFSVATLISSISIENFKIYPNPSDGIIYFDSDLSAIITIRDISNRIILIKEIDKRNNLIDLSESISGLYIIQIDSKEKTIFSKIILQ